MAKLRKQFPDAFNRTTLVNGTWFANDLWKAVVVDHSSLKMVVVANFEGSQVTRTQPFPSNGTWYDYINGGTINVSGNSASITLPAASATASSYRVYINQQVTPVTTPPNIITNSDNFAAAQKTLALSVYPNPFNPDGNWTTPTGAAYNPGSGCRTDRKPIRWNFFYNTTEKSFKCP